MHVCYFEDLRECNIQVFGWLLVPVAYNVCIHWLMSVYLLFQWLWLFETNWQGKNMLQRPRF